MKTTNKSTAAAKNAQATKAPRVRGLRQTMSDLHIWTGLLVGWLLYAMFLTGTVSYFRDEITSYMRPEIPPAALADFDAAASTQKVLDHVMQQMPHTSQVSISLPSERRPYIRTFWRDPKVRGRRGFESAEFALDGEQQLQARDTGGGNFFYRFHFNFYYMPTLWGRWLAGFCAMFMLVAIVSGVITHKKIFTDFFTLRRSKGQRSWLDGHAALSVLGLPFHFMITWSGLVTLMMLYMPFVLPQAPDPVERAAFTSERRSFSPSAKPSGEAASLQPMAVFLEQAVQRWGADGIGSLRISYPADAVAQVVVNRKRSQRISTTPQYMVFDGVSGELQQAKTSSGAMATTHGVLYGLHLGRYADIVTRWLYFIVGLAGTAMIGSGLVLWTVKRRKKLPDPERPYFGFRLVDKLNIATIAGLSVAMTAMLWLNRLLPLEMAARAEWEIHGFFILWAGTLAWALVRPLRQAWVELLWLAAALLFLLPLLSALLTGRGLLHSLQQGDWLFAGFDLCLLALGGLHAYMAVRTARYRPQPKKAARSAAATATSSAGMATAGERS